MNIAFLGLRHGHIFTLYNEALNNPYFNICGAYEPNVEARKNAESNGVLCNYETIEQILEDSKVDVIALGGCYGERGEAAIAALNHGKHVIADKPLCVSREELSRIKKAAEENNKIVSCMFTMRFEPKINGVKRLVESKALGEINNVYFGGQHPLQYGRRPMWYFEEGKHGGVINDIAIHGIDVLSYALGLDVENISAARCWNKFALEEPDFKDSAQLMLKATNDAGILADVSYAIPDGVEFALPYYWQFYIWGTKGTLRFSLGEEKAEYFLAGDAAPHIIEEEEPKTDYLTDFYRLIQGEKDVILPMQDVFNATEKTLEIQEFANKNC